jgi:uncharacterized protein YecA (UPF0149 family)
MEIVKGKKYLILEKPTPDTPKVLRDNGRSKMGDFPTYAGCPYDENQKVYDTGLDSTSREFMGLDSKTITVSLKNRKELVDYFEQRVKQTDHKDPQKFLENYFLKVSHNSLHDTNDMDTYLRLFLAMRGTSITPEKEQGNLAKYGRSMFKIVDKDEEVNFKKDRSKKRYEAISWMRDKLRDNRPEAIMYLKYLQLISQRTAVTEDYIIMEAIEEKVKDSVFLERFTNVIKTVPLEEIQDYNRVALAVDKGTIKKEKGGMFVYDGHELGKNFKTVAATLNKKDYVAVAERIFN